MLYFDTSCFTHQYHLVVQSGLALIDDALRKIPRPTQKYFAALATVSSIWRDHASAIAKIWRERATASTGALRVPPRCIAGRWGSIDATESFFMKKGQVDITTVLSAVLESKSKATSKGKVQDKTPDDDAVEIEDWENALDEQAAHSMKMKKWATIAWSSI